MGLRPPGAPGSPYDWGVRDSRWAGVVTRVVEVAGHPVRVLVHPGPPGGGGVPHLLLHGLGGAGTNWLEVMAGLARQGPVAAPDLPGSGETPPPAGGSARLRAATGFVPALCRALSWPRVVLHGNSFGGLVAVLAAAEHPELVHRLVLVAPALPAPRGRTHETPVAALLRFLPFLLPGLGFWVVRHRLEQLVPEQMLEDSVRIGYARPERMRPALRALWLENLWRAREQAWRPGAFAQAARSMMRALAGSRQVLAAVAAVEAPTLVVWGERDQLISRATVEGLVGRRPDWELATLPDCGHGPQLELPDRYLEVVGGWLARTGVPTGAATAGS